MSSQIMQNDIPVCVAGMEIRKAVKADFPVILALYERARAFMAENGNASQWGTANPPEALIARDIEEGKSYVCMADGKIAAVFYFAVERDPTYTVISGAWLNDAPYGVVHRLASDGSTRGAGTFCLQWALCQCGNIRIDTHRDNRPMQNLLVKLGFSRCGTITIADGTERIAFQKWTRTKQ